MKKKTRNTLIGAGIITAGIGAVSAAFYGITHKLVGVAMDRKAPNIIAKGASKLTGSSDMAEISARINAAEEKLKNSGCETVEITSHDGLKLVGHWYGGTKPKRVIVAMHGWRSSWTNDFGIISDFWFESDCAVLFAEQRAQGESEGEYMTFGLMERYDCLDWIKWVNAKTEGSLPIYLGGVSMGATTILMTAGLQLPENVKGIVADCAFTSTHDIWKHVVADNLHLSYNGLRAELADYMSKRKTSMGTQEYSTVDAMRECKVPVLFIHGSGDHFVPVEMTYENYEACTAEKRLLIVPGAEHGMSYLVDEPAYREAVCKFWEDFA